MVIILTMVKYIRYLMFKLYLIYILLVPKAHLEALRGVDQDLIETVDSHRKKLKEGWEKQLGGGT
jgi:hypothetical protein